jgi:hypothetical protein
MRYFTSANAKFVVFASFCHSVCLGAANLHMAQVRITIPELGAIGALASGTDVW